MSTTTILAGSVEYRSWPVTVVDAAGAAVDPTGDPVQVAFRAVRDPSALTWQAAEWDPDAATPTIRVLLGATPFVLAAGVYRTYLKVTDNPEAPILDLGTVYVAPA